MNSQAATYFPRTLLDNESTSTAEVREIQPCQTVQAEAASQVVSSAMEEGRSRVGLQTPEGFSDEVLLRRLLDGDREALSVLFRRYARMVRAVACRILRDESEADDLLQEIFLYIFRKCALFDGTRGSARSWIIQVTYHRAIDRRRYLISRHFYTHLGLDKAEMAESKAEVAFYEQSMEGMLGTVVLKKIYESLSEDQRRTIQLFFFEGFTLEEIAGQTGQTLGNIRNHYYRGLEKMRKHIFAGKMLAK